MLIRGYAGPKDQWQAELEKLSRFGLIALTESLKWHLDAIVGGLQRDSLLKAVRGAKRAGRLDALHADHVRYFADPEKWLDEKVRRSKAAKKAARRRKRARA